MNVFSTLSRVISSKKYELVLERGLSVQSRGWLPNLSPLSLPPLACPVRNRRGKGKRGGCYKPAMVFACKSSPVCLVDQEHMFYMKSKWSIAGIFEKSTRKSHRFSFLTQNSSRVNPNFQKDLVQRLDWPDQIPGLYLLPTAAVLFDG